MAQERDGGAGAGARRPRTPPARARERPPGPGWPPSRPRRPRRSAAAWPRRACLVPNSRSRSSRPSSIRTSSRDARSLSDARLSKSCRRPADMRWISSERSPASTTGILPRRPTPVISRPVSASSGGSKVFIVFRPGARTDSTVRPARALSRRRAVISTSGNSGIRRRLESGGRLQSGHADRDLQRRADGHRGRPGRRARAPGPRGAAARRPGRGRARRLGLGQRGRRARRGGRPRRPGGGLLLDRHRRLDRGQQGPRRARGALRRRRDRGRCAALERRQRARAVPAGPPPRRCSPRSSTPGSRESPAPSRTTGPTWSTWATSRIWRCAG